MHNNATKLLYTSNFSVQGSSPAPVFTAKKRPLLVWKHKYIICISEIATTANTIYKGSISPRKPYAIAEIAAPLTDADRDYLVTLHKQDEIAISKHLLHMHLR